MYDNECEYASALRDDISTLPMGENLVVLSSIGFSDHIQLSRDSILVLRELHHKHHVFIKT